MFKKNASMVSYLDTISYVTAIYDKRDDLNFHIVKFPYLDIYIYIYSNIPNPAYGIYTYMYITVGLN